MATEAGEAGRRPLGSAAMEAEAEVAERRAVQAILRAFRTYEAEGQLDVLRWEHNFGKLPPEHKALLGHLEGKYAHVRALLRENQAFLNAIVASVGLEEEEAAEAAEGGGDEGEGAASSGNDGRGGTE